MYGAVSFDTAFFCSSNYDYLKKNRKAFKPTTKIQKEALKLLED
jgi:hypothetical protein